MTLDATTADLNHVQLLRQPKPREIRVWNDVEFELLRTLAWRVPLLSESQALHLMKSQGCQSTAAVSHLGRLRKLGWLDRFRCVTVWPRIPAQPRLRWQPRDHDLTSDTLKIAQLRNSARRCEVVNGPFEITFYVTSRRSANLFGTYFRGNMGIDRLPEYLSWAQVALHLLSAEPELFRSCDGRGIPATNIPKNCSAEPSLPSHLTVDSGGQAHAIVALLAHASLRSLSRLYDYGREHSVPILFW